ncbi:hypothetical protein VTK73DRAFT_2970 [Phialemonium thermophilum]|uniref:Uncharacterized protein n=1 Tax=Phialemonium thermophilum TaxID=223376 RepID=A0ABR3VN00_9PEZI
MRFFFKPRLDKFILTYHAVSVGALKRGTLPTVTYVTATGHLTTTRNVLTVRTEKKRRSRGKRRRVTTKQLCLGYSRGFHVSSHWFLVFGVISLRESRSLFTGKRKKGGQTRSTTRKFTMATHKFSLIRCND